MKSLIISLLISTIALTFSGCGGAQVTPMKLSSEHVNHSTQKNKSFVFVMGSYSRGNMNVVSPAGNLAFMFYKAAKEFKKMGVKYFTLVPDRKVPMVITNFKYLINYCYPNNTTYNAEGWNNGSSSLEDKCNFQEPLYVDKKLNDPNNRVFVGMTESKMNPFVPTWSVEQVLHDPMIKEFIKNAKSKIKGNNKPIYTK